MGLSLWANIRGEIEYINNLVEFERNMQGQDDELEDDQWPAKRYKLFKAIIKFSGEVNRVCHSTC